MARYVEPKLKKNTPVSDTVNKDIFTLNGYKKVFETCESDADVHACLTEKFEGIDVGTWKSYLNRKTMLGPVKHLFLYWTQYCEDDKSKDNDDIIKLSQIFSLLENVFRNTLLRPYIPAYRTINMDCGRYRCFVNTSVEQLFTDLNFADDSKNLLTYQGHDPEQTIVCALTCSVFCHVLSMKLMKNKRITT